MLLWTVPERYRFAGILTLLLLTPDVCAQRDPPQLFGLNVTGSLRGRVESWDWFSAPPAQSSYTYESSVLRVGIGQTFGNTEWYAEGSFPFFANLPAYSVAPPPEGPLGYGGDYFSVNNQRNIAAAQLRQAFLMFRSAGGHARVRLGRFEFADGSEATPPDNELAALKRDRINQRLLSTFNYALRSLDGAQLNYQSGKSNFTAMAARLVEGSFQLRALSEINAGVAYAAYTRSLAGARTRSEARIFVVLYRDGRNVLKVDNRPQTTLETERRPILLATPGAHFVSTIHAEGGTADIVLWGAGQFGRWGSQSHQAGEFAVEGGYRFAVASQPWIRAGYSRSTGDNNPYDNRHTTFFQTLSSPRAYARFPFYILMNADDRFLQFRAVPTRKLSLRSELHSVRLSSTSDLWYDGGGPFQNETFGYQGRPGGGTSKVGLALDLSSEYALSPKTTLAFYGGIGRGGAVSAFAFPTGAPHPVVHLISLELIRRF